ncbi:amidase family protein [Microbacterium sp. YY-01]|uniref:amidase family protein n=1 Tax=Microbacterium sp. YY-01 TaxID=3421634 RepID=UPI003D17D36F
MSHAISDSTPDVAEWAHLLRSGQVSASDLTRESLRRIAHDDREGRGLHAVIECAPHAIDDARRLDDELRAGHDRGPLHGIPVLVKDNIATADGTQTTTGSSALEGAYALRDADLVATLREAGAVIIGKTNLSEWSSIRSGNAHGGWSGRGGQCRNPWDTSRSACGSSSGSAVAIAAGYVPLTIATETAGSIAYPASVTGITGIKPTVGLVSRRGIIPISYFQDSPGPMAHTVADLATALTVLALCPDPDTPSSAPGDAHAPHLPIRPTTPDATDYAAALSATALRGARLGIDRVACKHSPAATEIFEQTLPLLREAGATIVDDVAIPEYDEILRTRGRQVRTLMAETRSGLERYMRDYVDPEFAVRTMADVVAFLAQHPEPADAPDHEILRSIAESVGDDDTEVRAAIAHFQRMARTAIDTAFAIYRLDALIAPAVAPAARIDPVHGEPYPLGASTLTALAGYPIGSVNAGFYEGLPVGIAFSAPAWHEQHLLNLMHSYQRTSRHARPVLPDAAA